MIIKIFTLFIKLGILLVFCVRHNYGLFLFAVDTDYSTTPGLYTGISVAMGVTATPFSGMSTCWPSALFLLAVYTDYSTRATALS